MKIPLSVYDTFGYLAAGFLLLAATEYAFDGNWLIERDWKPGSAVFFITVAYILGHILANIASYLLEHLLVREFLKSPEELLFAGQSEQQSRSWLQFLFPVYHKPFPEKTKARILEAAAREGFDEAGRALFLHAFAVVKQDKPTLERLNTFLNLYGFCRNICLALLVSVLILVVGAAYHGITAGWNASDTHKLLFAMTALVASLGMLYRYLKFFRHYTMEVLNSYPELVRQPSTAEE
jgi:hypothetical protein